MNRVEFELCLNNLKNYHSQGDMEAEDIDSLLSYLEGLYVWASNEPRTETLIEPKDATLFFISHLSAMASIAECSEKAVKIAGEASIKVANWQKNAVEIIEYQSSAIHISNILADKSLNAAKHHFTKNKSLVHKSDKISKGGSNGGKAHHADDRKAFKNDYRHERSGNPTKSRMTIVDSLYSDYEEVVKRSTMDVWAAAADKEDGFARKAGRQKKNG